MRRRPLMRRALLAAAALLLALTGGYFFARDSSLFDIREVTVAGATGPDAPKVETALRQAARDMTTLNVDPQELQEAAAAYPTVKSVSIDRDLPHGVTLTVNEKRPVATVDSGGRKVPLAADGRLLNGATPPEDLPILQIDKVTGPRIDDKRGRQLVALVAAAPNALRVRATEAELSRETGLTLKMDRGPELYFGTVHDLQAKWKAVARVLADPTAEGATYIDVRVPERAAAGGLAPLVDPTQDDQTTTPPTQETPAPVQPQPSTGA
jgi:cell division protein FtsQ